MQDDDNEIGDDFTGEQTEDETENQYVDQAGEEELHPAGSQDKNPEFEPTRFQSQEQGQTRRDIIDKVRKKLGLRNKKDDE